MSPSIGYLGPRGTFTEEALHSKLDVGDRDLAPFATEQDVLMAVEAGQVKRGLVPIENSIEGAVNATLDILTFDVNLLIEAEIVVPVHHHLIAPKDLSVSDVEELISHPQATAQCRKYVAAKLPKARVTAANSTAEAVRQVADMSGSRGAGGGGASRAAAIGTELAARLYGLRVLDRKIEDFRDNQTRFVVVGRKAAKRTGRDKTSVVCFIHQDRPGSLLSILQEFAYRHINLTKIQSRPTKKALGDYCFWIDFEGHMEDGVVADALKCLQCKLREVKVLGSYPRATQAKK